MCQKVNCSIYIFGKHGIDYANVDAFRVKGIEPFFQEYSHPVYSQMHGDFLPYMSIVDLLFNHGEDSLKIILEANLQKKELQ